MEWPTLIAAAVLVLAVGGLYIANTTKYVAIREHETMLISLRRELDQIHHNVSILESTRPTTGELKALIEGQLNGKINGR